MRVAFVNQPWDRFAPSGRGTSSVGIVTTELAGQLAARAQVLVYGAIAPGELPESRGDDGITIHRIATGGRIHGLINTLEPPIDRGWLPLPYVASSWFHRGYARRVADDLAQRHCDIVHVHNFSQYLPVIRGANPTAKIVLHMHCDWLVQFERTRIGRRLQHADLVLSPSDSTTKRVRDRFPELASRCQTLHNGVDTDLFEVASATHPESATAPRLLYVGRISPEKGVHVLLEAFAQIRERLPDAQLALHGLPELLPYNWLVGLDDDPALAALRPFYAKGPIAKLRMRLIGERDDYLDGLRRQHGQALATNVTMHGFTEHRTLAAAYRAADLLVFPSVCHESFGMSLAEAMASGVPIVAADAGGITGLAAEAWAGVVVPRADSGALAAAALALIADPKRRREMAGRGRAVAETRLSWPVIGRQLGAAYDDLLATRTPPHATRPAGGRDRL